MDLVRGFGMLLGTPRLWPAAMLPGFASLVAYVVVGVTGWFLMAPRMAEWLGEWEVVGWIFALALYLSAFQFLFVVLGSAFLELVFEPLSVAAEREAGGAPPSAGVPRRAIWGDSARRMGLNVSLAVATVVVGIVAPPIGAVMAFLVAATVGVLDYTSVASVRRGVLLKAQAARLLRQPDGGTIAFGLVAGLLSLVPLVGPLAAPALVVGGTLLVRRRYDAATKPTAGSRP